MWERRPGDEDFCHVRVGIGTRPLSSALVAPEPGAAESRDPVMTAAIDRLLADRSTVSGLPVTVDLGAHPRIAVEGALDAARGLVRAMVCQLAVLHGPDVVTVTAFGNSIASHWDWLKWLPHHGHPQSGQHRIVIVDGDPGAAEAVSAESLGDRATLITIGAPTAGCLHLDVDDTAAFDRPD